MLQGDLKNQPTIANLKDGDDFFLCLAQYIISHNNKEEVEKLLVILASFVESDSSTD